jgi:hypothetical protein
LDFSRKFSGHGSIRLLERDDDQHHLRHSIRQRDPDKKIKPLKWNERDQMIEENKLNEEK